MRIGIVAGESSGDLLAAGLIGEIKKRFPGAIIEGIAGPEMVKQGCKAMYPSEKLALLGLVEVIAHYRELHGIREQLYQHFLHNRPDVFIGVDAPEFNLGLHEKLHRAGIKTVQYVSPQVWAWRKYRVKKIARDLDLVMTLFPFEAEFYADYSVPVTFVGHPLADAIPMVNEPLAARQELGLPAEGTVIAIMPGSRVSEARRLARVFLEAAHHCLEKRPDLHFVLPLANAAVRPCIEEALAGCELPLTVVQGKSRTVMAASDVLLMASGTATLEGLLLKKPMVVAYRLAWLTHRILKVMVKLPCISLPNLLAGRQVIPELIQAEVTAENLAAEVLGYLEQPERRSQLVETFTSIHKTLMQGTNQRAADAVLELVQRQD